MNTELIRKYNIPGPRYTSYPTVPYWDDTTFSPQNWEQEAEATFTTTNISDGISLYIHLPYCSTACHYCGCNMKYTQNHGVEEPYIDTVLKEWQLYLNIFPQVPVISEIHLGGGTPTFFSPENLKKMLSGIMNAAQLSDHPELSFEASPHSTTEEHLKALYELGFRRLSLGVQDFDPKVQEMINRIQSVEMVSGVVEKARAIGYESINFDLIYGLPLQTQESISETFKAVKAMRPDRIAYYSYAHVPWIKGIMRRFTEEHLPKDEEKRALYELGKQLLETDGYVELGMDHFALETDSLVIAANEGKLHRNFMGYTTTNTKLMVGLGVSAISDSWGAFAQNEKQIRTYQKRVDAGEIPVFRGHILNHEDLIIRKHILNIMCKLETSWENEEDRVDAFIEGLENLEQPIADGLVEVQEQTLRVPEKGRAFIRNICMAFDAKLRRSKPETRIFSSTI